MTDEKYLQKVWYNGRHSVGRLMTTDLSSQKPTNLEGRAQKIISEISIPLELASRIKHPECVFRIYAILKDGTKLQGSELLELDISKVKSYHIFYKIGPCKENCESLAQEIQEMGCYQGRIVKVSQEDLGIEKKLMGDGR